MPLTFAEFFKNFAILGNLNFWVRQFLSRFVELTTSYSGLIFFAVGFWFIVIKRRLHFFAVWFLSVVLYTILIGEYGYIHQYTALPYSPVNAVFIGSGIVYSWERFNGLNTKKIILIFLILAVPVHSFIRIHKWYKLDETWLFNAKLAVEKISSRNDIFLCNSHALPMVLYHIHRKGFVIDLRKADIVLPVLINDGFSFFVTPLTNQWNNSATRANLFRDCQIVWQEKEFEIFSLKKK